MKSLKKMKESIYKCFNFLLSNKYMYSSDIGQVSIEELLKVIISNETMRNLNRRVYKLFSRNKEGVKDRLCITSSTEGNAMLFK